MKKVKFILLIFVIPLVVGIFSFGIKILLYWIFQNLQIKHPLNNYNSWESNLNEMPIHMFFIVGVMVAPSVEELIFRYPLRKLETRHFLLSIALFFLYLSFNHTDFITMPSLEQIKMDNILIGTLFLVLFFIRKINYKINKSYRIYFVISSSLIFGLAHHFLFYYFQLDDIKLTGYLFLFADSSVHIILGFYFAFIRLRYSIRASILSHSFVNILGFINKIL